MTLRIALDSSSFEGVPFADLPCDESALLGVFDLILTTRFLAL